MEEKKFLIREILTKYFPSKVSIGARTTDYTTPHYTQVSKHTAYHNGDTYNLVLKKIYHIFY
jgi:hypothetical protein